MLHPSGLKNTDSMRSLLDEVVHSLVMTDVENGVGLVAVPQIYPGGDSVVIRIHKSDEEFFVSDGGAGYAAAEALGGTLTYGRIAPKVADMHGVSFDGQMVFGARVSRYWLANTVIFVATASRRAVEITAEKMSEEKEQSVRKEFQERLGSIFRARATFNVDIAGQSSRVRNFAALVEAGHGPTLFDVVTPHHVSINGAIVKFQDVAQLNAHPRRIAVLTSVDRTDAADLSLLSQWTTNVMSANAPEAMLRQAA